MIELYNTGDSMNKIMNLRQKELLRDGISGMVWIIIGFMQVFEFNKILKVMVLIALVGSLISNFIPYFVETDVKDELAQLNEKKSKSGVYDLLVLIVMICALISIFKEVWIVNLKSIMPFLGGGIIIFKSIFFVICEKVGD